MDSSKSKKITNKKQFEMLVNFMKENKHIAKGMKYAENFMAKDNYTVQWKEISTKLNSEGPQTRTESEWQKTWNDYKLKIQKKLLDNKKEDTSTGGGPNKMYQFSNIEEDVINLLNMENCVNPTGKTFGLNSEMGIQNLATTEHPTIEHPATKHPTIEYPRTEYPTIDEVAEQMEWNREPLTGLSRRRKSKAAKVDDKRIEIIQKQLKISEEMSSTLKEISRYQRKIYYLKEEKLKFYNEFQNKKIELKMAKEEPKNKESKNKIEVMMYKKRKLELELQM